MSIVDIHLKILEDVKFENQLKRLNKKLKNKKIIIYGAGTFFEKVLKNYDLSNINIIGVSDSKFAPQQEGEFYLNYKIIPFDKILEYEPDYVLISTLKFMNILNDFRNEVFHKTKIKVLPLVDRPLFDLVKELFE